MNKRIQTAVFSLILITALPSLAPVRIGLAHHYQVRCGVVSSVPPAGYSSVQTIH